MKFKNGSEIRGQAATEEFGRSPGFAVVDVESAIVAAEAKRTAKRKTK